MAHFAEIKTDNDTVIRVVVINDNDISSLGENTTAAENWVASNIVNDPLLLESFGGSYPDTYWKRTSYNTRRGSHTGGGTAFRGNYAGTGYTYDSTNDEFLDPKEYDSWTYNYSTHEWDPPHACDLNATYNSNEVMADWNEDAQEWHGNTVVTNDLVKWSTGSNSWVSR